MSLICWNCFREKEKNGKCPYCGYDPEHEKSKYPLALPEGTILGGRYIVGRVLGEGGFGITYISQEYVSKRLVAIKEYMPGEMATRTASYVVMPFSEHQEEDYAYGKECFLEEARILAQFQEEEHIVNIFSFFEENNTAYFAMEYIDGISLLQYAQERGGRLDPKEVNSLLFLLMEAIDGIHRKGVIHRDIAPDNILITRDGKAKLIDFGAARYSIGQRSMSLDVILKHGFAPMEQYSRRGKQGPFTDVYAMAATYYYAITGKVPPDAIERVTKDKLILPSTMGISLDSEKEKALEKGLALKAEDRYQSMGELLQGLRAVSGRRENEILKQREAQKQAGKGSHSGTGTVKRPQKKIIAVIAIAAFFIIGGVIYLITKPKPPVSAVDPYFENSEKQVEERTKEVGGLPADEERPQETEESIKDEERNERRDEFSDEEPGGTNEQIVETNIRQPSAKDLDEIQSGIRYPLEQDYLDEYIHAVVVAPHGHSVLGFGTSSHDGTSYTVLDGEEVLIIAEHKGFSCAIIQSTQRARWINSEYLQPIEEGTAEAAAAEEVRRPSAKDLDEINSGIRYPEKQDYLDEYIRAVVVAPHGHSVLGFGTSSHDGTSYTVLDGEEVLIIAEHKGFSCAIIQSTQKARWINSDYLEPIE